MPGLPGTGSAGPAASGAAQCGCDRARRDRSRYRCSGYRRPVSVTSGTIFDKTRIPLSVWFQTAWLMTSDESGVSAWHLYQVLAITSYQSPSTMLTTVPTVMASTDLLSRRVEVDETLLGGPQPDARGPGAFGKTLVAGAVEIGDHSCGRARLYVIPDASAASPSARSPSGTSRRDPQSPPTRGGRTRRRRPAISTSRSMLRRPAGRPASCCRGSTACSAWSSALSWARIRERAAQSISRTIAMSSCSGAIGGAVPVEGCCSGGCSSVESLQDWCAIGTSCVCRSSSWFVPAG